MCSKWKTAAVTSHEGNYEDYLRRKEAAVAAGASRCWLNRRKQPADKCFVSGHGFSRAEDNSPKERGFSPCRAFAIGSASNTIVIEGGFEPGPQEKPRRLNPIKQKQMEDRCAFLEEEVPRIESAIAHTEEQLGVYVSAAETQRLSTLAEELRAQSAALTAEWEELMLQLEA